jgi:pimeloyl-ACP methyl ester carboxylesterase
MSSTASNESMRIGQASDPKIHAEPAFVDQAEARVFRQQQARLLAEQGVRGSSYFLAAASDRPVHVLEAGRGAPLVMLHGGGAFAGLWASLMAELQDRFRCLALDRPGHGLSYRVDYRRVDDYRAEACAFVERSLDELGLERATLVGSSMGGFFSLAFALKHPERVERLVLLGAPAGLDRALPLMIRLLGTAAVGPVLWRTVARPSRRGMGRLFRGLLVADGNKVSDLLVDCGVASHAIPGADVAWLSLLRRFLDLRGVRDGCYLRDEVAALAVPTHFVWGERDAFAPPTSGQELAKVMPAARITVVPKAGHLPWIDAPQACAIAMEGLMRW